MCYADSGIFNPNRDVFIFKRCTHAQFSGLSRFHCALAVLRQIGNDASGKSFKLAVSRAKQLHITCNVAMVADHTFYGSKAILKDTDFTCGNERQRPMAGTLKLELGKRRFPLRRTDLPMAFSPKIGSGPSVEQTIRRGTSRRHRAGSSACKTVNLVDDVVRRLGRRADGCRVRSRCAPSAVKRGKEHFAVARPDAARRLTPVV